MAMGARIRQIAGQARLPRPRLPQTWEGWAFLALMAVALGTRLWDLGGRSLHYDEILHAWYSWRYAEGEGYSHTPLTHGPFLFHAAALTFSLIGSSDFAVRLLPSLFGVALVGMPYLLRRELGRYGVFAASLFLLISPSILYFGRFIRNDIYMAVWALALVVVIFRYMERPRTSLLFAWAVLWAFALSSKESAYLLAGTFGLFLLIMAARPLWDWVRNERRLSRVGPAGDLFVVLGTLSLPLWAPVTGLVQGLLGIVLVNPDPNDPRVMAGDLARAAAETGAPVGGALFIAAFIALVFIGVSIGVGLLWDRRRWPLLAAAFLVVWLPLFTSLFTNWQGFFTGFWGSLGYWIAQQPVERASQPWYYYIVGLWTYEFFVLVPALLGAVYLLIKRRAVFDIFIVAWAALTFVLFTIAGERMPWLLVGITMPLAVVAGRAVGMLMETTAQSPRWPGPYLFGAVLGGLVTYLAVWLVVFEDLTDRPGIWIALGALPAILLILLVLGFVTNLRRRRGADQIPPMVVLAATALGVLTVAGLATGATAVRAGYSYAGFERPQELLVYSQTGQETTYGAECLGNVAEASGLGRNGLRIFVDESDNFAWQWRWYLRDYGRVTYRSLHDEPFDTSSEAPVDYDIVMMSQAVENASRDALEGFERVGELRHLWWFPNYAYDQLRPADVLSGAVSREGWSTALNYVLWRELATEMQRSRGVIYVHGTLAEHAAGCTDLRATSET